MAREPDAIKKKFGPLMDKTLKHALAHQMAKEFPRFGGPRMLGLCSEMVLEVVEKHIRSREDVRHGQVLWTAVSVDDPPARGKRIRDTDLVPVVLDLSTLEDIQARLDRKSRDEQIEQKAIRLCRQAYQQGALLSNCDLAELLNVGDSRISSLLADYERRTDEVIPRRATLHDMGSGLTHKRIICWKHYADGKPANVVARETYHSLEAVDRYLAQFDRVRHCRQQGFTPQQTAYTLNCSQSLVHEYLQIDQQLEQRDG